MSPAVDLLHQVLVDELLRPGVEQLPKITSRPAR